MEGKQGYKVKLVGLADLPRGCCRTSVDRGEALQLWTTGGTSARLKHGQTVCTPLITNLAFAREQIDHFMFAILRRCKFPPALYFPPCFFWCCTFACTFYFFSFAILNPHSPLRWENWDENANEEYTIRTKKHGGLARGRSVRVFKQEIVITLMLACFVFFFFFKEIRFCGVLGCSSGGKWLMVPLAQKW